MTPEQLTNKPCVELMELLTEAAKIELRSGCEIDSMLADARQNAFSSQFGEDTVVCLP